MAWPCLPLLALAPHFVHVLCVGPFLPPAGAKARTRRSGAEGQEKNETDRFHEGVFASGNFLAGTGGRQIEMLRFNKCLNGSINLQFTKGTLPE
jgi:hypothetical protein